MPKNTIASLTIRTASDIIDWFRQSFDGSGTSSQGEFLSKLLEKWNAQDNNAGPQIKTETIEVEKQLQENELLINLSLAQMFALRGTVLGNPEFAQKQNEIIDRLKGNKPFLYSGELFSAEFKNIWIRNIVLTKAMTDEQKEAAIKFNMAAFLVNMFMVHLIEGNIDVSTIDAGKLKEFIAKSTPKKEVKPEQTPVQNEPVNQ